MFAAVSLMPSLVCRQDILLARDMTVNTCRHAFHRDCILEYMETDVPAATSHDQGDAKGKGKKGASRRPKTLTLASDAKTCPVCFLPLALTLDLRGMGGEDDESTRNDPGHGDDGDDDDDDEETALKAAKTRGAGLKRKAGARGGASGSDPPVPATGPASSATCVVCMDKPRDALIMPCGHMYTCMACISQLQQRACPICRVPIQTVARATQPPSLLPMALGRADDVGGQDRFAVQSETPTSTRTVRGAGASVQTPSVACTPTPRAPVVGRKTILQKVNVERFASSTKIDALVREITAMIAAGPDGKAIVFSQYTQMIDLVEWRLKSEGIRAVKLVGSMPMAARRTVLQASQALRARQGMVVCPGIDLLSSHADVR